MPARLPPRLRHADDVGALRPLNFRTVSAGRGRRTTLLRILMTNACSFNCHYCPMRRDRNMPRALLFGLVAGAIGAAIWFAIVVLTERELGLVAVIIGALVGTGVLVGSGNKRNVRLQLLSVLITLAAMTAAEYFIVRHFVVAYLVDKYGATASGQVPMFLPLDVAWDFVVSAIQDDPLTLLFWGIAV